jgi:hypothetical protein
MSEFRKATPEEIKSTIMEDARLINAGAEVVEGGRINITDKQIEDAREKMEGAGTYKDLAKHFTKEELNIVRRFLHDEMYTKNFRADSEQEKLKIEKIKSFQAKLAIALENAEE